MEIKKFNFIKDEPILPGSPGYFDFYHKSFSPALKDMVLSDSCPHTIGLFSKWGTGKSSIIDQLRVDLKDEKNTHVLVFDAWKYQEDSLRRTFLIYLEKFLKEKKCEISDDLISGFYKKRISSVASSKEVEKKKDSVKRGFWRKIWNVVKEWKVVIFFLILPLIVVAGFTVAVQYYPQNQLLLAANSFFTYLTTLSWIGLLLKPVADKALEKVTSKIFESTKTYTEIRTKVEEEDRLNSPEQFEYVFTELVGCVKEGKLIIVFDNIDRVQGDIALKTLSTIKTFLDIGKSKVIFLVPCDANAINKQIQAFYNNQKDKDFDESEYLKKLFNVIINTPEFIEDDLKMFTSVLIDQTGDDMKGIIKNDQVLSVVTKAFKNNPREVKQFINNLVSAVLVASKTEVAEHILSSENIGYFTKVTILKQKFPSAYKRLKENWSEPEKIIDSEVDEADEDLRSFLTLTSTISTTDAEPFIYFKKPQVASIIKDAEGMRKALIEGNIEDFEKLASVEADKANLIQYVAMLLRSYKSQAQILFSIFKTQIQAFSNLQENSNGNQTYLEETVNTIEIIWDRYLELPTAAIFDLIPKLNINKRNEIINRYISALAAEEIKVDSNKPFLSNLIDQFIKNFEFLSIDQKRKLTDALRQNLGDRVDVFMKFDTLEKQKNFIHPDVLRKVIQETLNNKNFKTLIPVITTYKDYIIENQLSPLLVNRVPEFMSAQNAEHPTTTLEKIAFYIHTNNFFKDFKEDFKKMAVDGQQSLLTNLQNAFNQSAVNDSLQYKIAISLHWLHSYAQDLSVKARCNELLNQFISQSASESIKKFMDNWSETSVHNFIKAHMETIKNKTIQDESAFMLFYECADEGQKLELTHHFIDNKPDYGLTFLRTIEDKIPNRQKVIEALLQKARQLSIQQRVDIFNFLKGKIAKNDDVNLKQSAIKQFYEYLRSTDQSMVQFGAVLLKESFLSDTDEREIVKEMLDYYNTTKSSQLQPWDIPAIEQLVEMEPKFQEALKEKLIFLILSNISPNREHAIQHPLVSFISKMKPNSDTYEKDYSDLVQRLITWPESAQKDIVVKYVYDMFKNIPGAKSKEYLEKIKPILKEE
ncbi:MAG: P-loop NTPase fold protein [Patescibacteria group bacterium]